MNIKERIRRWLGGAGLCLLAGAVATGCNDDLGIGNDSIELGEKVYGKLSVPFGPSDPAVVTRSVDFSDNAQVKVDSYWIGVYDTYTGELLGTESDTHPRKSDGNRYTMRNDVPFIPEEVAIWYYEQHPEAYIVGVINYENIQAKKVGETGTDSLRVLLREAKTFEDFCRISVDATSATSANRNLGKDESCPLMMGFYTVQTGGVKATVNADGSMSQDNVKIRFADNGNSTLGLTDGAIRLKRLLAEINVNVTAAENIELKDIRYKVVNNPTEVYLAEHTTDNAGSIRTEKGDYDAHTANSADLIDGGYTSYGFRSASRTDENSFSFSYQEYENKHWGRSRSYPGNGMDEKSHFVREEKYVNTGDSENDVFKSLCNDASNPFNNKASYMVIEADIVARDYNTMGMDMTFQGTVTYTIHEGCACNINGTAGNNGFDYQRNRNTSYTYNINIAGIDEISMQVNATIWGDKNEPHNDGLAGNLWVTKIYGPDEEWYNTISLPIEGIESLTFRFWEKTPEGETNYGDWKAPAGAPAGYPAWEPVRTEMKPMEECPFLDEVTITVGSSGDMSVEEFLNGTFTGDEDGMLEITFTIGDYKVATSDLSQLDNYRRGVYFSFNTPVGDSDGCICGGQTGGFEQKPEDGRQEFPITGINPVPDHNYGYHSSPTTAFWGVKGTATYICWSPIGPAEYYMLQIDDREPIRVEAENPSIHYNYPIPGDMKTGYHTINITPVGDPNVYKPSFPRTLSYPLEVFDSWNFGTQPFFFSCMGSGSTFYSTFSFAGLTVRGGGNSKGVTAGTTDNPYIQTNGSGNTSTRSFSFTVNRPGTVRVRTCSAAGNSDPRNLVLYQSGYGIVSRVAVTTPNTERNVTYDLHTQGEINDLTDLYVYTEASLRIYEITFIPD
ncbi:MAG: hypothetical protein J1E02_00350 [Coprobacter sp.]|nr:hypothetical protein [Coprobacter sp.]